MIIPTRFICLMKLNYPGAEFVRTALQFREKNENSTSCVHVLHKTLNLVSSRRSCAQNGTGRTCSHCFANQSFCFVTFSLGVAVKLPNSTLHDAAHYPAIVRFRTKSSKTRKNEKLCVPDFIRRPIKSLYLGSIEFD